MWESLRKEEVLRKLNTNQETGLAKGEANSRKQKYGKNKLDESKKENLFIRFIKQFNDFMIIILIIS